MRLIAAFALLFALLTLSFVVQAETSSETSATVSTSVPKKTMNIRGSPLGLLVNYINADLDIAMSETWTLGPTVSYWNFDLKEETRGFNAINLRMLSVGARANWYPSGVFQSGFFISPMFQYMTATAKTRDYRSEETSATASVPVVTALAGYQWFGQTLNFSIGAGLAAGLSSTKVKVSSPSGGSTTEVDARRTAGLALDLMLGYAF